MTLYFARVLVSHDIVCALDRELIYHTTWPVPTPLVADDSCRAEVKTASSSCVSPLEAACICSGH